MRRVLIFCMVVMYFTVIATAQETSEISITQIADGLNNPRGVAVMPNGDLLVVEAGTGSDQPENIVGSGRILQLSDDDDNGYFTDEADTTSVLLDAQPSFNSLAVYRTGHDEPFGLNDIYLMDDGRIFFTRDHPFAEGGRNTGGEGYYGEVGIYQLNLENGRFRTIAQRSATLNALAYHPENELFYATESGFNQIMSTTLDGEVEIVAPMPILANNQQPVPAGIAVDPTTGDVLVALFSGFVYDYFGTQMGFMPGDARVVRVDTETGAVTDEITGLTTAIDVTVDAQGNIYVVELTTVWEPNPMPFDFDLTDDTLPPDPGGYARYTGSVSMLPVGSDTLMPLATGLDMPSNITFHEGALYVSIGLGTPQRRVLTPQGIERIDGRIVRITGF